MRIEVRVIEDNNETVAEFYSNNVFPPKYVTVDVTEHRKVAAVVDDQSNTYTRVKIESQGERILVVDSGSPGAALVQHILDHDLLLVGLKIAPPDESKNPPKPLMKP